MILSALMLAAATPSPAPSIPAEDVTTPGPWGFIAFFGVAIVVVLLVIDMTRRIRRVRYRAEVNEKLDAEARAQAEDRPDDGSGTPTR
ncbi:hypothetical protein GCM10022286_12050 [Gryllotalpicola daejeonensis]|uniref:Uncharacterized protein n=1 Tax=Gryllotalpicola daejeonensis TaxID=993087 RepID=A0ABP7ZID3_9MICO